MQTIIRIWSISGDWVEQSILTLILAFPRSSFENAIAKRLRKYCVTNDANTVFEFFSKKSVEGERSIIIKVLDTSAISTEMSLRDLNQISIERDITETS